MKRLIAGIAIALVLAACTSPSTGATPVPTGAAAPASAPPPTLAPDY